MRTDAGGTPLVVLSATATPPWLDALPGAFATLWERAPWVPPGDRIAVELATTEIATNIVQHSPAPEAVEVLTELDVDGALVRVILTDTAPGATVDLGRPMPAADAESGRGVALARRCLDRLTHTSDDDGGNVWVLERRTGPTHRRGAPARPVD